MKTHCYRRLRLLVALLVTLVPVRAGAQNADTVRVSVVSALSHLRDAVERKDWPVMSGSLPAGSEWQKQIEQIVKNQSEVFSFWVSTSRLPLDSLHVEVINPDAAEVEGPLFVGRARGYWWAQLKRLNGRWQLAETREQWDQ